MSMSVASRLVLGTAASAVLFFSTIAAQGGAIIQVRAGENLQNAINAAQPGDTLMLEAGATFTGNFVLPVKPGANFITIRSATADASLPNSTTRIDRKSVV